MIPVILGMLAAPFASILIQPPVNAADNFDLKQWSKRGDTNSDGLWDDVLNNYDDALRSQVRAMMAYDVYRMCGYAAVGGASQYSSDTIFKENKIFSNNQQTGYDGYIATKLWDDGKNSSFSCQDVNGKTGDPVSLFKDVWKVDITWSSTNPPFGYYCNPDNLAKAGIFKRSGGRNDCNDFQNSGTKMYFNGDWFPYQTKPNYGDGEPRLEKDLKKGPVFAPVMKYFGCGADSTGADCILSHIVRRALTEDTPWKYKAYMMELEAGCITGGAKSSRNEIPGVSIEVKKKDGNGNETTVYYEFEDLISNADGHAFAVYFPESGNKSYLNGDMFSSRKMSCKDDKDNSIAAAMNGAPFDEYMSFYNKLKTKVTADNAAAARAKSESDAIAMLPLCESYLSDNPTGPKASDVARLAGEGTIWTGDQWDDIENETFVWDSTYNPICRVVDIGGSRGFCALASFQNPGPPPGPNSSTKGANMIFGCGGIVTFDPDEGGDVTGDTGQPTCTEGGALSWIMCPVAEGGLWFINLFMEFMQIQLRFEIFTGDTGDMVRQVWGSFLTIANIAFAIAFMIIIYSTATSVGLKNYDVKKILPRLVIAAILVNTSFWICAAISDVINILGANIYDFIVNNLAPDTSTGLKNTIDEIMGTFGLVAVGGILILTSGFAAAILGLLLILAVLAFRQIAIIALIIISPLAFVVWLLPNTEKWFKKWWTEYTKMLFIYPIIMGVWGLTRVLLSINGAANTGIFGFISWIAIQIAPVALIIPIFKMGGQIMGKLQGLTSKGIDKFGGGYLKKKDKERAEAARNDVMARRMERKAGVNFGQREDGTWYNKNTGQNIKSKRMTGRLNAAKRGDAQRTAMDTRIQQMQNQINSDNLNAAQKAELQSRLDQMKDKRAATDGGESLTDIETAAQNSFMQKLARNKALGWTVSSDNGGFLGITPYSERAKARIENARENSLASKETDKYKLNLKNSAQSFKTELEKQQYEIAVKARPEGIAHEAMLREEKARAEGPTEGSREFKILTAQLARAQASGDPDAIAAATSARDAFQGKISDANLAKIQNTFRTRMETAGAGYSGPTSLEGMMQQMMEKDQDGHYKPVNVSGLGFKGRDGKDLASLSLDDLRNGRLNSISARSAAKMLSNHVDQMGATGGEQPELESIRYIAQDMINKGVSVGTASAIKGAASQRITQYQLSAEYANKQNQNSDDGNPPAQDA